MIMVQERKIHWRETRRKSLRPASDHIILEWRIVTMC